MARLDRKPLPWKWRDVSYVLPQMFQKQTKTKVELEAEQESMRELMDEEGIALEQLQQVSDSLPPGEVVHAVLNWPRGDGHAFYIVTKAQPLTLQWIPFCDAWQVDPILIRGLRRQDVLDKLEQRKAVLRIFPGGNPFRLSKKHRKDAA